MTISLSRSFFDEDCDHDNETRVKKNTRLHDEIVAWEERYSGTVFFSRITKIKLHGVINRTNAHHAEAAKVEKESKMENDQREEYQKVLIELRKRGTGVLRQGFGIAMVD